MSTEEQIRESLGEILIPGTTGSLIKFNLVRRVAVSDGKANISLVSTALNPETQGWLGVTVPEFVKRLPGIVDVEISFEEAECKDINEIGSVIAVMSGKGGVGKSLVSRPGGALPRAARPRGRHSGCRYHRSQHPNDVRHLGSSRR